MHTPQKLMNLFRYRPPRFAPNYLRIAVVPVLILCLLAGFQRLQAQANHLRSNNANAWFMYVGDHKISPRWGVHLEAQFRRFRMGLDPQQLLLRTGLNYHVGKQVFFTAGYCFVQTYPYGAFPVKVAFPEHRIWEQLQIKSQVQRMEWVSRFRLEQRFSHLPEWNKALSIYEPGDAVYTHRFRLLNRFSLPLHGKVIVDKSFYLSAYDEFFINFGKQVAFNFLDQNRAYIALGYCIPKLGRMELGFMEQTVYKPDGVRMENNHTLQIGLSSNLDFFTKKTMP